MNHTPRLPVADLADSLAAYLKQVRPLLTDEEYAAAAASARAFRMRSGMALQNRLEAFARATEGSWLLDDWLAAYLKIRTPLPLASNVGFGIRTQGASLAEWTAALASVCADYRHGRVQTPATPQGTPLCMAQWQILRGAARIPQNGCDGYRIASEPGRHIGVLYKGFYYRMAALDQAGEAFHPDTFARAFGQILQEHSENPFPVAVPCFLGGNETARVYRDLRKDSRNARLLDDIETDLFHISISSEDLDEDDDLAHATFAPQQHIWCYKPLTFCYNTATGRLFLHCEHTWEDGGALKGIVSHAAALLGSGQKGRKTAPTLSRHAWHLTPPQQENWPQWQQRYAARAGQMRVGSVCILFGSHSVPKGISHDALMQFLLQYAQLAAYGRIRNTYEAVDASHFAGGRTECVRPVSEASAAFAASLLQDKPVQGLLDAALAEHKARIKTAKSGLGANRHLLGLALTAKRNGRRLPAFFNSPGYRTFSCDFLSTSTLGDDSVILNFAFAPTTEGGLGVNYTLMPQGWRFTLSHTQAQAREAAVFLEALKQGGSRLLAFLDTAAQKTKPIDSESK